MQQVADMEKTECAGSHVCVLPQGGITTKYWETTLSKIWSKTWACGQALQEKAVSVAILGPV